MSLKKIIASLSRLHGRESVFPRKKSATQQVLQQRSGEKKKGDAAAVVIFNLSTMTKGCLI